jgi:hypothetical protein
MQEQRIKHGRAGIKVENGKPRLMTEKELMSQWERDGGYKYNKSEYKR